MDIQGITYLDRFGTIGGVGRASVELLSALSQIVPTRVSTPPYHAAAYAKRLGHTSCKIDSLYSVEKSRYVDPAYWLEKYKIFGSCLSGLYLNRSAGRQGQKLLVNYPQDYAPPKKSSVKFAVLIYDLNWQFFPGNFSDPQGTDHRCRQWIELSEKVFTISETTRNEILECYGTEPSKVVAAPLAHFSTLFEGKSHSGPWANSDYWLYPAALAEHKGHDFLLEALATGRIKHPVVLTCPMPDADKSAYQASLLPQFKQQIAEGRLRVTGYTSENEYKSIIENARAYLLPSRYEGYGLPLVEALAAGKPVVASDITAFHEICDRYDCHDAVETFFSGNAESLIQAVQKVEAGSGPFRLVDLNSWTWQHTAERIVQGMLTM